MSARMRGFIALMGLTVGCGGEVSGPGGVVVRDSAGISVITYPSGPTSAPVWSLSESPTIVIGEVDGRPEILFTQIAAAFSVTNGTLVVADATSREIRWFDRDGVHIRTVGRRGEGPGEFRNLSRVERLSADTILAWDEAGRRLSFFSEDGAFLASHVVVDVPESFEAPPGRFIAGATPQILGFFRDGSILSHPMMLYIDVPAGVYRDSIPQLRYDLSVGSWERVGTTLPGEYYFNPKSDVLPSLPLPFGVRTRTAVEDDWFVIGWGDDGGLSVFNHAGELEAIIRPNFVRLPVRQEEIEEDRRSRVEARAEVEREQYRRELQAVSYPSVRPAHGAVVASDSEFWVEATNGAVTQEHRIWFVFSRSGILNGSVEVPSNIRITDVQQDHIVGVTTNELGVPSIVRFELLRGG